MSKYNPSKIERKWQKYWKGKKLYETRDQVKGKENFMLLTEFPYPSGNLHIGHWYAFSVPDILARFLRMQGKNVVYPIGFDAFGLPAENAAIKNQVNPQNWTEKNIAYMTKQLGSMGAIFDWSRVLSSIDPEYYRWTQWMFLQFYKKGLAYRAKTSVNWCPKDNVVLANEQVVNGRCWRCETVVVQKELAQWMFKITAYADRLIDDLDQVNWSETIKTAQRNWIGRSEGAIIRFQVSGSSDQVEIFTTRPDTLFGATYLVLAPEHPLLKKLESKIRNQGEVQEYIEKSKQKTELTRQEAKEKTGIKVEGVEAINPINNEKLPIWVADFVLAHYGTGAVFGDAHDERDFEFAKKYNIPLREVLMPAVVDHVNPPRPDKPTTVRKNIHAIVYDPERKAYLALHSSKFNWHTVIIGGIEDGEDLEQAARREIREETGYTDLDFKRVLGGPVQASYFAKHKNENRVAIATALYFELISDKKVNRTDTEVGEVIWIPAKDFVPGKLVNSELPFWLERLSGKEFAYTGHGVLINSGDFNGLTSEEASKKIVAHLAAKDLATTKTNYKLHDWVLSRQRYWGVPIPMIYCEKCARLPGRQGYQPVQEKDLPLKLPKLEDYKPSPDGRSPLARAEKWLKVKCPSCGGSAERETDTMDTFVDSSWYFLRYTDPKNKKAFADKKKMANWLPVPLYIGGAEHNTMHLLYSRFFIKALYDLGHVEFNEPYLKRVNRGFILGPNGLRMSKSRGNVIDPDEQVTQYGADTVRMYLAFLGPYGSQDYPWDPKGINGVYRFLHRIWKLATSDWTLAISEGLESKLNLTVKKVGEDIHELKFNTAISELMKLLNVMEASNPSKKQFESLLILLAPFAPHITEEIWQEVLGHKKSIHLESWPEYDERLIVVDKIKLPIQVNGKVRGIVEVPAEAVEEEVKDLVLKSIKIKNYLSDQVPKRFVYVPGKVFNIII